MHARRDRLRQCRRPAQCGANRGSAQCRQPRPPCVPRHVKFVLGRRTLTDDSPVSDRASTCLALLGETAARVIRVCSASLEQTQRDLRLTIALHLASNYYYYDPAQATVHVHVRVHAPAPRSDGTVRHARLLGTAHSAAQRRHTHPRPEPSRRPSPVGLSRSSSARRRGRATRRAHPRRAPLRATPWPAAKRRGASTTSADRA
jgi:hypothetical protein